MSPDRKNRPTDGELQCRWGVYVYLCRNAPPFRILARQEWNALKNLSVDSSVSLAVQQDTQKGARKWSAGCGMSPQHERLGARNQGCVDVARNFLAWASTRAKADHSALVLAGTGVLDPWSEVGAAARDPAGAFAICDDAGAHDALDVSELKTICSDYRETTGRLLDVLVLDMSAMQWLEVAYQLQGLVRYVVGAESPVPLGPCPIAELVSVFSGNEQSPDDVATNAKHAAEVLNRSYSQRASALPRRRARDIAPVTVSALSLAALEPTARAFDTLSHALMLALGDDLVWNARVAIARAARERPFGPDCADVRFASPFFARHAYDFAGLIRHVESGFNAAQRGAVSSNVANFLGGLNDRQLLGDLEAIDNRANHIAAGREQRKSLGPKFVKILETWGPEIRSRLMPASRMRALRRELATIKEGGATAENDAFWTEWALEGEDGPRKRLLREIRISKQGCAQAKRLEDLAKRVSDSLSRKKRSEEGIEEPLIIVRLPDDSPGCGLAIFRPLKLDDLLDANYLHLDFNRRSHWTALLAVINLVDGHPRAMWRVIESILAAAPLDARTALLQRVFGPTSGVGDFREQLNVLAPPIATLSITERGSTKAASNRDATGYVVRYTPSTPLAAIQEKSTSITAEELHARMKDLGGTFTRQKLTARDVKKLDRFGRTLGEDVITVLAEDLKADRDAVQGPLHVQLQLPRELMRYPWELMHDPDGRLVDRYALARQVYVPEGLVRSRPRMRHQMLRALVVAAPLTSGSEATLHASVREGQAITNTFVTLKNELGYLIDFDENRDTRIGVRTTVQEMRELMGLGDYDIVHFSGHGVFEENEPDKSGWVLSDDVLRAEDISNTLGWAKKPPWLVFANACQSAKEDAVYQGDLHGLASAFINNGVAAYIGASWNVADMAGYLLATRFYETLCLDRKSLGQALFEARQVVRVLPPAVSVDAIPEKVERDALLALTSYSFVLFGDPTALALSQIGTETGDLTE